MSVGVPDAFSSFIALPLIIDRPMKKLIVRVQVPRAILLKVQLFWDVTP